MKDYSKSVDTVWVNSGKWRISYYSKIYFEYQYKVIWSRWRKIHMHIFCDTSKNQTLIFSGIVSIGIIMTNEFFLKKNECQGSQNYFAWLEIAISVSNTIFSFQRLTKTFFSTCIFLIDLFRTYIKYTGLVIKSSHLFSISYRMIGRETRLYKSHQDFETSNDLSSRPVSESEILYKIQK